jgi:hypothetical protein
MELCRSLAVYRMILGQPRQEDLVALLMNRLDLEDMDKLVAAGSSRWPPSLTGAMARSTTRTAPSSPEGRVRIDHCQELRLHRGRP